MAKHRPQGIRAEILARVFWSMGSPVPEVARAFGVTRQAVQRHVAHLVHNGAIITSGNTKRQRFRLRVIRRLARRYRLRNDFTEDVVWNALVRPRLGTLGLAAEEADVCHYGLTEMTNNVIDHADARQVRVAVAQTATSVQLTVRDDGVGIFRKVADALALPDPRQAPLELIKGKFTTDPRRHTGEGIFFTSRAFDRFSIVSHSVRFVHTLEGEEWLTQEVSRPLKGTAVTMELLTPGRRTLRDVFSKFSSGPEDYRFAKTEVPLKLAAFGDENLVSRSSARRVLARAERFDEVVLDFAGVRSIGQGFADEIFRVFRAEHTDVRLCPINANDQVSAMIRRAEAARDEGRG